MEPETEYKSEDFAGMHSEWQKPNIDYWINTDGYTYPLVYIYWYSSIFIFIGTPMDRYDST